MPKTSKSRNTTDKLPPVHPGGILREALDDLNISMRRVILKAKLGFNR